MYSTDSPLTCDTRPNDEMLPSATVLCVMITITIRHLHSLWASTWWIPTCLIRCIMKVYEVHLSQQLTHPKNQHPNECLTCEPTQIQHSHHDMGIHLFSLKSHMPRSSLPNTNALLYMQVLTLMHFFLDWELLTAKSILCSINWKNLMSLMRVKEATTK